MIRLHFPGLPVTGKEYRMGSSCIIHDSAGRCIVIDGGEDRMLSQSLAYVRQHGITHATHILTHWHPDHDRGLRGYLEASGIVVDRIYCPPLEEVRKLDYDDYSRGSKILVLAKKLGKPVEHPRAGVWTEIRVGEIRAQIWRRAANTGDKKDFQVNNTSMQVYLPDLYTLITGDTIVIDQVIKVLPGKVVLFDVPHHGNACPGTPSKALKAQGAEICVSDDIEPRGTVGATGFTATGARRTREAGIITLTSTSDIDVTCAARKMSVSQSGKIWSYPIPYSEEVPEGWVYGSKGWWYQYKDGTWPTGWAKLRWSKGVNWFFFDASGWMQTGWIKDGGWWYYLDPATGAMQTGWLTYKGKRCYLEPTAGKNQGHAYMSQTAVIDGKTYVFDADCYAVEVTEAPKAEAGKTRLNVIDIASYQSGLDLSRMKGTGLDGVIIKATQGTSYVNPCCNRHYEQAKEAGLLRGLYHYADGSGAIAEAHYFVDHIKGYLGDAILCLDWEGNQNKAFGKMDVGYCRSFLDCVYHLTGIRPLIYMSKSVCRAHDWSSVAKDYGLWAAQYANMNQTGFQSEPWTDKRGWGAWESPAIYQYSSRGKLAGYDGNLDMDIAYMSAAGWRKYATKK